MGVTEGGIGRETCRAQTETRAPKRARELLLVGSAAFAFTLLLTASERLLIGAFNDDGVYVVLGKAIASGQGYRSIHFVGDPVQVKYPPGYPTLLALLWLLGGSLPNVAALIRLVNGAVVATAVATLWYYGRFTLGVGLLPLAVFAIGPLFLDAALQYHSLALAEPYFVLGWAAGLLLTDRVTSTVQEPHRSAVAAGLGLVMAATALFRTHGTVLIPAVLVALALRRVGVRPWLTCAAAAVLPLAAWQSVHHLWTLRGPVSPLPDESSYLRWFIQGNAAETIGLALATLRWNVCAYASTLTTYLSGARWLGVVIAVATAALTVYGVFRARKERPELGLTLTASLAPVLLWPFTQDRLLLVLLPFAGLGAARAVSDLVEAHPSRVVHRISIAAMIALVGIVAVRQVELRVDGSRSAERGTPPAVFSPSFVLANTSRYLEDVIAWISDYTTPDDRILVEFPAAVYLYTGRKSVNSKPSEPRGAVSVFANPGEFLARRILDEDVTVLVIGNPAFRIFRDALFVAERCPSVLRLVAGDVERKYPLFFRVVRDDQCLRGRVLATS